MNNKVGCHWERGFTLIELLVVISIIALLLSILMPALGRVKEAGRKVVCLSHARQLGIAFNLYASENEDKLPPMFDYGDQANYESYWGYLILKYVAARMDEDKAVAIDVLTCPSRTEKIDIGYSGIIKELDYGVNYGGPRGLFNYTNGPYGIAKGSAKISQIKRASEIFAAMDSQPRTPTWGKSGKVYTTDRIWAPFVPGRDEGVHYWTPETQCPEGMHGDTIDTNGSNVLNSEGVTHNGTAFRHNKDTNVIFLDAHAETVDVDEWLKTNHWQW